MKEPRWDAYEAAVLLDYVLRFERGEISRREAAAEVSRQLRERAKRRGLDINETFRNTNGISMQFESMRNRYLGKVSAWRGSKLFGETVDLYRSDPEAFRRLLESERDAAVSPEAFRQWLHVTLPKSENNVLICLAKLSLEVIPLNRLDCLIQDIAHASDILRLREAIVSENILRHRSLDWQTETVEAFNLYLTFAKMPPIDVAALSNCDLILDAAEQPDRTE